MVNIETLHFTTRLIVWKNKNFLFGIGEIFNNFSNYMGIIFNINIKIGMLTCYDFVAIRTKEAVFICFFLWTFDSLYRVYFSFRLRKFLKGSFNLSLFVSNKVVFFSRILRYYNKF